MKMFEYMAAHVPIVATDLPSLREVLDHGRNAWLVAPDDVHALAGGLRQVLDDPGLALKLAAAAADDVSSFTWDKRAGSILAAAAPATRGAL
jgi:glycosyltransferase involved in cell wall biosynthesis